MEVTTRESFDGNSVAAGVCARATGLETPMSAGFAGSVEHALKASNNPSIANPAIMAIFCCLDQEESIFPEMEPLLGWMLDLVSPECLLFDCRLSDFQVVVMLSPLLRLAQSKLTWQENGQHHFVDAKRLTVQHGIERCIPLHTLSDGRHIQAWNLTAKISL